MSTDSEQNLKVLADHVRHLTAVQDTAIGQIAGANRSIVDPANAMWDTHGVVCSATNIAVSRVAIARRTAGGALSRVSTELSEKLTAAASAYENTDAAAGGDIDACGV
jgi:Excreted virulence factor EspC, type VII ESX diderm